MFKSGVFKRVHFGVAQKDKFFKID
jgi:hypothetical protein